MKQKLAMIFDQEEALFYELPFRTREFKRISKELKDCNDIKRIPLLQEEFLYHGKHLEQLELALKLESTLALAGQGR